MSRIPLLKLPAQTEMKPRDQLIRSWAAQLRAHIEGRAVTNPATTTTTGWAAELAVDGIAEFVGGFAGLSASGRLIELGMRVSLDGVGSIAVPNIIPVAADAGTWVVEGAPIPVRQGLLTATTLEPRKLAVINVYTWELAQHSDIEAFLRRLLSEAAGLALDAAIFDANAASTARPAGIRNGIAALTAATGNDDPAMMADLTALAAAVAGAAGSGPILFIASPAQAVRIGLWSLIEAPMQVIASSALADGIIIAVAANAFVSGFGSEPEFSISDQATVHMDDSPAAIGTVGTPTVIAAPTRSLWQQGLIGIRMILPAAWGLRAPSGVAWLTANW
jgi:hypothetical protein